MLVRELMSAPVATVGAGASLHEAVGRLLEHDVGSLVVVEDGPEGAVPAGILTATDVLAATHDGDRAQSDVRVEHAASSPLTAVEPDRTVRHAVDRMVEHEIEHLPVVDGLDVVGILTLTDVALGYDDLREEAMDLVERRGDWSTSED